LTDYEFCQRLNKEDIAFEHQRKCILRRLKECKDEIFDQVFSVVDPAPESKDDGNTSSLTGANEGDRGSSMSSEKNGSNLDGIETLSSKDSGEDEKKKKKRKKKKRKKSSFYNDLAVGAVRSTTLFLENLDRILRYNI